MQKVLAYLKKHEKKELCRFIACGSVDDGKSTLIGRLLYDTKAIFEDHLNSLQKDSKKLGTQGENLDFALLLDGLSSEREQGITIDVAYRFFSSEKRKFIIADTPGHEQYTRNMATGASTADIAIILIDARKGVLTQTKRHSYIVNLLGIKQFIIAINKMDLVDYDELKFNEICKAYKKILLHLNKDIKVHFIPISALNGENIAKKSSNLSWYKGKTLIQLLDDISLDSNEDKDFVLPVQYVNRPNLNFRAFCGQIAGGAVKLGDEIVVLPSGKKSKVKSIIGTDIQNLKALNQDEKAECIKQASIKQCISLCLEDEIDISRGDVIVKKNHHTKISNKVAVMLICMSEKGLDLDSTYIAKLSHSISNARIREIKYKQDINNFKKIKANTLKLNDIAFCEISFDKNLVLKKYDENKALGAFILIDKYSNQTLAAAMVQEILDEDSQRVYTKAEKELNAFIRKHYPQWGCKKI